jgi:DNA-binding response OmpR family regulator
VLIADDNADMRQYLERLLSDCYQVQTVPDGNAALAAARTCPPDLLLSDIMMPGLDGIGLLRAWRADPGLGTLPVILLSARADEEARVDGLHESADDYLIKPFSARELLARVAVHLHLAELRKRSLEAVRENEERFRAFTSVTTDVVYRMNADWTEMRHLAGREFIADTLEPSRTWLANYILPEDQPRVLEAIHLAELRKRSLEAVRENEERFRAFTSVTTDVVYRMNADWTEMRHLAGREFIADTLEPSRTWLANYSCSKISPASSKPYTPPSPARTSSNSNIASSAPTAPSARPAPAPSPSSTTAATSWNGSLLPAT